MPTNTLRRTATHTVGALLFGLLAHQGAAADIPRWPCRQRLGRTE